MPSSALIIPNNSMICPLHPFNALVAVMLLFFGSTFRIFLMRQTFKTIPRDWDDASRMDDGN